MENCDHAICPVLSILVLYDPACKAWLLKKFIFELEPPYSFKIICLLVRQVISLKENGSVISKSYCLVSWSPTCNHIILASALMRMASTSTTIICTSIGVETTGELLI